MIPGVVAGSAANLSGKKRKKSAVAAQINPSALSDVPTERDEIGFFPYVRALAWFLSNEKTKPPLTISIEGAWGSGKSSLMLQLQNELRTQNSEKRKQYYVNFNAWRSDKDEALWAAFALTFIKQLAKEIPFLRRVCANASLLWNCLDWKRGWFQLAQFAFWFATLVAVGVYTITHTEIITNPDVKLIEVGLPLLAAIYFGYEKATKLFGNPLTYDLSKFVHNLKYEDKVAFIDRFQDDFAAIVKSYVGQKGKVFIFIDDLDRCEIPRAAELLQAINLLLSADQGNLFFILGLDREMVAAGIAAKNEKILPYLAAERSGKTNHEIDLYRLGIEYGFRFMEKFIQVPFRVPHPDESEITRWVSDLIDTSTKKSAEPPRENPNAIEIHSGSDPQGFESVVEKMAQTYGFNPRSLKQFINVFRLRVLIALSTGVLIPAPQNVGTSVQAIGITIQQLGLFTAILMRWPRLSSDLVEMPTLLTELRQPTGPANKIVARWQANDELVSAIELDTTYTLMNVNLRFLLMVMPNTYSGLLGGRDLLEGRTLLVGALETVANTPGPPSTGLTGPTGATGATGPIPA